MIVVADDFTGAAEIAAAGFERGIEARVARCARPIGSMRAPSGCLIVLDTDTRLKPKADALDATARLRALIESVDANGFLYKKTDSALRGNVVAEIEALMALSRKSRALLLPANPSTGRVIVDRVYRINGVPLDKTEFARDPHHPARSADPMELLGSALSVPIHYRKLDEALPETGIVVCEASCIEHLETWASRLTPEDLPAGGRDFFQAVFCNAMNGEAAPRGAPATLPRRSLVVQGSLSEQTLGVGRALASVEHAILEIEPSDLVESARHVSERVNRIVADVAGIVESGALPIVRVKRSPLSDSEMPRRVQTALASMARQLWNSGSVDHFLIEGGATANSILQALDLYRFGVRRLWSPGVVTLSVDDDNTDRCITTKPGSYPWSANLVDALRDRRERNFSH